MKVWLLSLVLFAPFASAPAGPGGPRQEISFHFESALGPVPDYTIAVNADGTGKYWTGAYPTDEGATPKRVVSLTITAPTVAKIFAAKEFIVPDKCETHLKNVAKTGKKTFTFYDNDRETVCVFNYSDDEKINAVASTFQEIAYTLQEGDRLKHDHRFDHLGLDADLDALLAAAKDGNVIEVQNIAPVLQSIVDDDEIMSPSRRKAKSLLELAGVQAPASAR
ncbi:MAG TPA: hypothetical protein VIJ79_02195 [Acidobacteriaceae bacterium]